MLSEQFPQEQLARGLAASSCQDASTHMTPFPLRPLGLPPAQVQVLTVGLQWKDEAGHFLGILLGLVGQGTSFGKCFVRGLTARAPGVREIQVMLRVQKHHLLSWQRGASERLREGHVTILRSVVQEGGSIISRKQELSSARLARRRKSGHWLCPARVRPHPGFALGAQGWQEEGEARAEASSSPGSPRMALAVARAGRSHT